MKKTTMIVIGIALAAAGLVWPANAKLNVWTLSRCERVMREDAPGTETAVRLQAARNEWESFQILVRSDTPVSGVTLTAGALTGPGNTASGLRVDLYRQHQLNLTDASFRNDSFRPGWYPDALIPFAHPLTGKPLTEARFKAVPFELPANETHGFWIDVYVPAETKAGDYTGSFSVKVGERTVDIPLTVTVWDFTLPATMTMQSRFGSPASNLRAYCRKRAAAGNETAPIDWSAADGQICSLLAENRLNAIPTQGPTLVKQPDNTFRVPPEQLAAFREFVDTYHLNAYAIAHPRTVVKDPEQEMDKLHAWLRGWDQFAKELNRPQVMLFIYLKDEPNDAEAYKYVQKWGKAIRAANSVVKVMVTEQTKTSNTEWGDLFDAVDVWCPLFPIHDPETAAQRQALGEVIWTYTALCQRSPATPWWQIDYPLLNYRVPAWIAWRYRMRGILYWGGMSYWKQVEEPWTDPKTLDRRERRKGLLYNGEGSLLYPGQDAGYDGVAASLRLKALRDGIEDYELLAILERAGEAAAAEKIVLPLAESWFKWEKSPAAYETARAELAKLILALPESK